MSTDPPTHVPVLIIGGGIVGLTASLLLTHQNTHSLLIERHVSTSIHPRARRVNGRTMEIYRGLGISDAIREAGASLAPSFGIYSGPSLRAVIEAQPRKEVRKGLAVFEAFARLGPEDGAFATQDVLEPVLLKTARERKGGDLMFNTECLDIQQDENKVTAKLRDRGSENEFTIAADYLIAADGANSPIRSQLNVPTTGRGAMGFLLNILFRADLKSLVEKREFSLCVVDNPEVSGLFTAINNSDRWVFHLCYDPSKGETPADFPPRRCVELLRKALGIPDIDIEVKSVLPWEPTVRVVTKLQHGRVFFAGDAAHQMPPYAGLGANSGISDVHNLAWKLAAVLKRQAGPELLETYDSERLEVGKAAAEGSGTRADERGLILTKKNLSMILGIVRMLPLMSGFGYVYSSRAIEGESTWPLGGLSWKAWSLPSICLGLDGRPGSRAPHVWVERAGERISTTDLLGKGYVILAGSEGGGWIEASQKVKKKLDNLELASYCLGPNSEIMDKNKNWEVAVGISSRGAVLVRPDGFVAWRERRIPGDTQHRLEEVLRKMSCL